VIAPDFILARMGRCWQPKWAPARPRTIFLVTTLDSLLGGPEDLSAEERDARAVRTRELFWSRTGILAGL